MQIIKAPNQILRSKAKIVKKITEHHLKITKQMIKLAASFQDPEGVGLAAPQIGILERFFVAKLDAKTFDVFFNPEILLFGKRTKKFLEGCLSIPDYYGEVRRPIQIKVTYINKEDKQIKKILKGLQAMIFQHEYDHLQGILFVDYALKQNGRMFKVVGKDKTGSEVFEEVHLA